MCNIIMTPIEEHKKPEERKRWIVELMGDVPVVELPGKNEAGRLMWKSGSDSEIKGNGELERNGKIYNSTVT